MDEPMTTTKATPKTETTTKPFRYLISLRQDDKVFNKLIKVDKKRDALQASKTAFQVNGDYILEWYMSDFDDYAVVDEEADIPNAGKARLIRLERCSTPRSSPPPFSAANFATDDTVLLRYGTPLADGGVIPLVPVGSTPTKAAADRGKGPSAAAAAAIGTATDGHLCLDASTDSSSVADSVKETTAGASEDRQSALSSSLTSKGRTSSL
ncbi:uncharacterized protein LOC122372134, partial [Amphibalanus amphitrite]|uniref:uncharacterized protein LOC122372134 n=1 Tax=Amphibalanus amphitrite TaxID=1232801 RepID=UPI001C92AB3A